MITIKVAVENGASQELRNIISALTGPQAVELSEQSGLAARNAAIEYHRSFDKEGGWRGNNHLGPSSKAGGSYGAGVASGWALESWTSGGAVIANGANHYAFKVKGGTITPKRGNYLTIPLIQEAKGYSGAASYQQDTGKRLFRPKGKNVLFERLETITSGARGKRGAGATQIRKPGIRAVYALVKSVTMGPWPNAVPPLDLIAKAYTDQYREGLNEI